MKNQKGTAYLRLGIGLICTAFFASSVLNFQRDRWRETLVIFIIGLLPGYYYT